MKRYSAIGVMSGTSCDGLDLALCSFTLGPSGWTYRIQRTRFVPYAKPWKQKLLSAPLLDAKAFVLLDHEYGQYIGNQVKHFTQTYKGPIDVVASHGHTIFHQPELKISCQIGHGADIAAACGISTITDFRSLNVAIGGQGAPLVPIGDELLFWKYHVCLNLGGFSNISYMFRKQRIAFDICPVNFLFNHLASKEGKEFDKDGELGRSGKINEALVHELDGLDYYHQAPPKSLGREWFEDIMLPVLNKYDISTEDLLRSAYEHAARQITMALGNKGRKKILLTGGGAYNQFFVERLRKLTHHEIDIPDDELINFKEALIFAFLGVLRWRKQVNCLASVSGGRFDCSGGSIYLIL